MNDRNDENCRPRVAPPKVRGQTRTPFISRVKKTSAKASIRLHVDFVHRTRVPEQSSGGSGQRASSCQSSLKLLDQCERVLDFLLVERWRAGMGGGIENALRTREDVIDEFDLSETVDMLRIQ